MNNGHFLDNFTSISKRQIKKQEKLINKSNILNLPDTYKICMYNMCVWRDCSVMVTIIGKEYDDPSSNLGWVFCIWKRYESNYDR